MRRKMIREETRRLILEAAYSLFEEKGYRETTMRELATSAGVGLGTIFQHFPDKAALLEQAFAGDIAVVMQQALETLPPEDVAAQLRHVVRAMFHYYGHRPRLSRELVGQVFLTQGQAAERLRAQMEDGIRLTEGLFESAKARGELREDADCSAAALACWSYYLTCLNMGLWAAEPDLDIQARWFDRLLEQLLLGLGR